MPIVVMYDLLNTKSLCSKARYVPDKDTIMARIVDKVLSCFIVPRL